MAKLKKYPKKPKASSSVAVKENFLARCKEVDKVNAKIKSDKAKSKTLDTRIAKIGRG